MAVHGPYRTPARPEDTEPAPAPSEGPWLLWMWFVIGLVPFVGVALHGNWSQLELGVATVILIFSGRALARQHVEALRSWWRSRRRERARRDPR